MKKISHVFTILAVLCLGIGLTYVEFTKPVPQWFSVSATVGFLVLVGGLIRMGVLPLPADAVFRYVQKKSILPDFAKGVLCFAVAFAWAWFGTGLVNDTPFGVAVVAGPGLLLLVVGTFFVMRRGPPNG